MAKGLAGAYSSSPVSTTVQGKNLVQLAYDEFGEYPVLWGRYFTSASTTGDVEYQHAEEDLIRALSTVTRRTRILILKRSRCRNSCCLRLPPSRGRTTIRIGSRVSRQRSSLYNRPSAILLLCILNSGNVNRASSDDWLAEQANRGSVTRRRCYSGHCKEESRSNTF